jgi:exodeoxyribonuclease VII large subunit
LINKGNELKQVTRVLDSLSYQRVLDRGFALVANAEGHPILDAATVSPGMALDIRFRDGNVAATASGAAEPAKPKRATEKKEAKKESSAKDKQGTLL